MNKEKNNKLIDSIAYILWTTALWMLSYYQSLYGRCDFEEIRYGYGLSIWLWGIAAIILYGESVSELTHEIFKSSLILIGTGVLDLIYYNNSTVEALIKRVVCLLIYQCMGYGLIKYISKLKKLHGKYAKKLLMLYLIIFGFLYLLIKLPIVISLVCASVIDLILGCFLYLKNRNIEINTKAKCKVKYKGEKYLVNRFDGIKIRWIKLTLIIKRIKRRGSVFIPKNIVLYIVITLFWVLFSIFSYYVGIKYKEPELYTVKDVVWEIKNSYFTSVVLAILIAGYSQNSAYKKKMQTQHDFYMDNMMKFDHLFEPFIGDEIYYYMPFYNHICLDDTLQYIEKCNSKDCKIIIDVFKESLEEILEQLDTIEYERRNNNIIGMHSKALQYYIQETKELIRKKIKECENFEQMKETVREMAEPLFYIISDIRRPWRWDIENDIKILRILANYKENSIEKDFYYSMHLYGHNFKKIQMVIHLQI